MASTAPDTDAAQALRQQLHSMWAAVAPAWAEHSGYSDERGAALSDRLLDLSEVAPGDRVLELACGAGGVGLAAAARVGPDGQVVLSDVVPEMTATAAARAAELGYTNVETAVLDFEAIDAPDDSFDVVVCREGLMFATDPTEALREIRRVLRPGGRLAFAVWGTPDRNPWLGVILQSVSEQLGRPVPPPGIPGPFALGDPEMLAALPAAAGFTDGAVEEMAVPMRVASFDEWWSRTSSLAGPLALIIGSMADDERHALEARLREAVRPYATDEGLEFPGLTLIARARK